MYFVALLINNENKRKQKYRQIPVPYKKIEKAVKHKGDGDTDSICSAWNGSERSEKYTGTSGAQRKNRDHPDDNTDEITTNTYKNSGYLKILAVIQTPLKYHDLKLERKTRNK